MRAVLERPGAEPLRAAREGAESLAWGSFLFFGSLVALVAAAVFAGGGAGDGSLPWIGGGVLVLSLGAVAAALAGALPRPVLSRAAAASVALFTAFVAWNGLTVAWSIAPDRSWSYFNRGAVYLGFLVAGLFAGALARRAPTLFAAALAVVLAAAAAWALAGKIDPSLFPDGGRIARLREPVGFWNALALLLVLGLPLGLWVAAHARAAVRVAGAVFLYALGVAILLTYSRGGLLAALFAVPAWLAVAPARREALAALVAAAPVAVAVALWAFGQPGIAADGQDEATRAADGKEFAVVLALGGAAAAVLALLASRAVATLPAPRSPRLLARAALAAVPLVVVAALVLALAADPLRWVEAQAAEFRNPSVAQDPSRLTSLGSNNRFEWWQQAWEIFRREPLLGTGAGSFAVAHKLVREIPITVTTPHNVLLQFLSETGIVGALLAVGGATAALAALVGAVRRLRPRERAPAAALAVGFAAYLLHSLVDWDWDFLAVNAPVFAAVGVVLAAPRAPERRSSLLWAPAPLALLAALLFSLAAPRIAEERVDAAYRALAAGRPDDARAAADTARSLNPLALEPLLARAEAAVALGNLEEARRALVRAVEIQPLNPEAWYELGYFELRIAGEPRRAARYLARARELDPYGPAQALLAELRAAGVAPPPNG